MSVTRSAMVSALGVAMSLGLGGCNRGLRDQYDLALQENSELRQLNSELIAQNEQLQSDLAAASAKPANDTGFDIDGVNVGRNGRGEIVLDIAGDVLFDSGSATLKSTAKKTLDQVATVIKGRYGSNEISVDGHTDTDPIRKSGWKTNERLSAERAMAVEQYLASRGISESQMRAVAYGPSKPKSSKKDSRRVEIVILASGQ